MPAMNMTPLPSLFHVKKHDELLAILEGCRPSGEMFWVTCDFKPTALFAEVEPLYRRLSETEDMEEIERIDNELLALGLRLIDVKNNIEIKYFTFFIEGETVTLRYAEPPYLDE
jgi:hypothetical protein